MKNEDRFKELKSLLQVKKLIALMLTLVFCVLAITRKIQSSEFMTIFGMVVAFYFGQSTTRQAVRENRGE